MPDDDFPPAEESLHRLHRSGWSCGEAGFTSVTGRVVVQVDGRNGENKLQVQGATPAEAWHRAVEAAAGVGMWQARAGQVFGAQQESGRDPADLIKHGDYLVNGVSLCGDCHTPRDDRDQPDRTRRLRGATLPIRPKKATEDWADEAHDITRSGLAGKWSEEEMVKFLTTGLDPDGTRASPPMPAFRLNARDARAVFLYLKSLPGPEEGREKGNNPDREPQPEG